MDAVKLENIVRTKRGMTFLIRRFREIDSTATIKQAKIQINKIWNDKTKTDEEIYKELADLLVVDDITVSREQFLQLITNAVDHCEDFFMDPLEAVHMLTENMLKGGGLKGIARRLDMFSKKI